MDSFEINKILGAILFTCLGLVALNITAGALFAPEIPAKPGYEIAVKPAAGEATKAAAAAEVPIEQALASADPKRGEAIAKVCQTCHNFTKGSGAKIGPDLWDVVERPKGSVAGFSYSDAMKSKGGNWTVDDLNSFLTNPRGFVAGTKMTFAGLPHEDQRADVIAYLDTLSDHPKPLPKAAPAAAEAGKSAAGPPPAPPAGAPPANAPPSTPPAPPAAASPPAPSAPPADHKSE
jgi:cytochrome c